MNIIKASQNDFETVKSIIHITISKIYPKYYPAGAVDYFLKHHSDKNIQQAINNGEVYLFENDGIYVGTGSIKENDISRLFILPKYQGKGYGTQSLDFFEDIIFKSFTEIILSASFPAYSLYSKRGYQPIEYNKILTENGDYLCYHLMKLSKI